MQDFAHLTITLPKLSFQDLLDPTITSFDNIACQVQVAALIFDLQPSFPLEKKYSNQLGKLGIMTE